MVQARQEKQADLTSAGTAPDHTSIEDPVHTLARLVHHFQKKKLKLISLERVFEFPRAYRRAHAELARLRTLGVPRESLRETEATLAAAHGILHRKAVLDRRRSLLSRTSHFLLNRCPGVLRSEWRLLLLSFVTFYGLAVFAFFAVERDIENAYQLLDPSAVRAEISQLEALKKGESFKGNFTFGIGTSPLAAGGIMAHNMSVGVLFFAAGLVPPFFFYMMAANGLMLGSYTAIAHSYGQGGAISSVLWCHGVIEIQALVLAGCAGLILFRGLLRPGMFSRARAMAKEGAQAWHLLAPIFPMLLIAGMIEGFISPHAPLALRLLVALSTALILLIWALLGGRSSFPKSTHG